MPKFIVGRMERHCQPVTVTARNAEEAINIVNNGGGDYEESQMEYVETLSSGTWTVERIMEIDLEAPLCLSLWHGRKSPDEDLEDWGDDGPIFFVYDVHVTYNTTIRLSLDDSNDEEAEILFFEDMVYYDGVFYGDWTIFSSKGVDEGVTSRAALFDPDKAKIPDRWRNEQGKTVKQKIDTRRKLSIPT